MQGKLPLKLRPEFEPIFLMTLQVLLLILGNSHLFRKTKSKVEVTKQLFKSPSASDFRGSVLRSESSLHYLSTVM